MLEIIKKYKHKVFTKNVISILQNNQYILKDYYSDEHWCMCLCIGYKMIFVKKKLKTIKELERKNIFAKLKKEYKDTQDFNIQVFNSYKEIMDFNLWKNSDNALHLMRLIDKAHDKKFKGTFLIENTEHMIEDLSNFLRERSIVNNLNIIETSKILEVVLIDEFSHLYVNNKINNEQKCEGVGFD